MKRHLGKRHLLGIVLGVAALASASGVAFAYWTATGSGTGSGSADMGTSPLTVVQTTTLTAMYPGDTAQTISGTFNNTNKGPVFVSTVTVSIASVDKSPSAPAGTCTAGDFTLANAVVTVNAEVPVGSGVAPWTGPTIKFNDKPAVNQDACKGATVNLGYSIP